MMRWLRIATAVASLVVPCMGIIDAARKPVPRERAERHEMAAAARGERTAHPLVVPDTRRPPATAAAATIYGPPAGEDQGPPSRRALEELATARYAAHEMARYEGWLLAQVQAESDWNCEAESIYASGCAQFTPPTWGDYDHRTNPPCDWAQPTDPGCSFAAQATYMGVLVRMFGDPGLAAAAYNAGPGWIRKEQAACRAALGCDPDRWIGNVEHHCVRAAWACAESRKYVLRIARLAPGV